jgi:hypothetical protein
VGRAVHQGRVDFNLARSVHPHPLDSSFPTHPLYIDYIMDGLQLRDEAAQDRVRAAVEFLDPSMFCCWIGGPDANIYFFFR